MTGERSTSAITVSCRGAARTFGAGASAVVAVRGVTCDLALGQRIALMGPSGSGKSTLLHLMAGLDEPTVGSVEWPALGPIASLRPRRVAVVFQSPSLIPTLDLAANVSLPLLLDDVEPIVARRRAIEALQLVDLGEVAGKLPEEISGGESQRAAVARALVVEPSLLLADEPTGQLDHRAGHRVIDALLDVANRLGASLVVATHDREIAARLDEVWVVTDGRLATRSTPRC